MKGIRVVDLTSVLSGPYCTWLLASMGADVIKVENPNGDSARTTSPFCDDISIYFASINRNKRSICLDLKSKEGKSALHALLATADVLVENMRPGVRNRLGCSDEDLKRINPKLVRASITGFGQEGSLSDRPAYDIIVQAMSGMMSINGSAGGAATRVGFSIGDIAAALFTTIGIIERLYSRDAQNAPDLAPVDISMLACQWACMENAYARYFNAGIIAEPLGSRHPSLTPFEPYPTADYDIVIGIGGAKDWPRLCEALGRPDMAIDPRFVEDDERLKNRDILNDILGSHLRTHSSEYWLSRLIEFQIPCSAVNNIETLANSDLAQEYRAFSDVVTNTGSIQKYVRSPITLEGMIEKAAPELGEHSEEILRELGFTGSDIKALSGTSKSNNNHEKSKITINTAPA
ncbi:MAG: CoA transferase [Rhodospirillales bacterium]|jgi:CoA:oxalate CoA-transferase|nr:CoA transferase [Rhodospirillales bacterium]